MRVVLYYFGDYDPFDGKFMAAIARYRRQEICGIVAFEPSASLIAFAQNLGVPVAASIDAFPECDELVVATLSLPCDAELERLRMLVMRAYLKGIRIRNGCQERLADVAPGARELIDDLRHRPRSNGLLKGDFFGRTGPQVRLATIGTDGNIGKMTVAIELHSELKRRGIASRFLATGQIGMFLTGEGAPLDAIPGDFMSGAVEELMLPCREEILIVEGQGSIFNPTYSGVTMGLLHGAAPHLLVLCGSYDRKSPRCQPRLGLPTYREAIDLYERLSRIVEPTATVIAMSVITSSIADDDRAREVLAELENAHGLAVTDVVRFGIKPIADSVYARLRPAGAPSAQT